MKIRTNITAGVLLLITALCTLSACSDELSYAEQAKRERKQISSFLTKGALVRDLDTGDTILYVKGNIKEISEAQFLAQGETTNLDKNEYVKLNRSGIYMQIVRKGAGTPMPEGTSRSILSRYIEYNISGDSLESRNNINAFMQEPDIMSVIKANGVYTASYTQGVMYRLYGPSVPSGWLVPLQYINIGRSLADGEVAEVRIIVPHQQGQSRAQKLLYSCFYQITYRRI